MKSFSLPITIIASVLVTTLSAGIAWGLNKERLDSVTKSVEDLRGQRLTEAERLRALEVKTDYIIRSMDRIENRLGTKTNAVLPVHKKE